MIEWAVSFAEKFGPFTLLFLAYSDSLFFLGYIFWGIPLLASLLALILLDAVEPTAAFLLCFIGTFLGSATNFFLSELIWNRAKGRLPKRVLNISGFLRRQNIIFATLAFTAAKFWTGSRPIAGALAGVAEIQVMRYVLMEVIATAIWVGFWCVVAYTFTEEIIGFFSLEGIIR